MKKPFEQEVLDDMLCCGTCADIGNFKPKKFDTDRGVIEYYLSSLPGMGKTIDQLVNYVFSNDMTAGGIAEDKILNQFLFRKNFEEKTNYSVLQEVVGKAHIYGEWGLRFYEGNVYSVPNGTYAPLISKKDGLKKTVAYIVHSEGRLIRDTEIRLDRLMEHVGSADELKDFFAEQKLILLDKSEFLSVRNKSGASPLLSDDLRLELLVSVYERLTYDVNYDGPGRILMFVKDGYVYGDNEVSSSEVLNASTSAVEQRAEKAKAEVKRIANEIKNSGSDAAIAVSAAFDKDVIKMGRVTKATEFFDWLENEGKILADVVGLPYSLLEEGQLSGNVSMTRIVDNAMINTIIPLRRHYATQFSAFLSEKLGLSKIYFEKYTLQSEESPNSARLKVATTMQQLNTIEGNPKVEKVIDSFAEMLDYDIHDSVGDVVELKGDNHEPDVGNLEKSFGSKTLWRSRRNKNR